MTFGEDRKRYRCVDRLMSPAMTRAGLSPLNYSHLATADVELKLTETDLLFSLRLNLGPFGP